jgi:oligopeptide transport system permease protein
MTPDKLEAVVQLIQAGNKSAALAGLMEIIRADPKNERAWRMLSACVEREDEKLYCLQQAQSIQLNRAVALLQTGEKPAAQAIFREIALADPKNETAWMGLFACAEQRGQKRYFLQQVLSHNPQHQTAQRELLRLGNQPHLVAQPGPPQVSQTKIPKVAPRKTIKPQPLITLSDVQIALRFMLVKLAWVLLVLFGVSVITFLLVHSIPGNPWQASGEQRAMLNISHDPATMRQLDRQFGLDQPLWKQYTTYVFGAFDESGGFFCGAICGNLGPSFRQRGGSVVEVLFGTPEGLSPWQSRFGYTARLVFLAFAFTSLVGVPLGILLAVWNKSRLDQLISGGLTLLLATPNFVLGILLIIILASWLRLFNIIPDWKSPSAWVLPVIVLAAVPTATLARLTKAVMFEAVHGDYVRTAYAKGLRRFRIVIVHVLPNALVPIVTALAPILVELVAGSFIVEALFGFPGIGREYWLSIAGLDYSTIMGLTLFYCLGMVSINVLVESLYGWMDPRLRNQGRKI